MEEAVTYFDTVDDAEYFITEPGINVVYFGADEEGVFRSVADLLRDIAKFGRTRVEEIIDTFDEAADDSIVMYRNFDTSPLAYSGNITDSTEISTFVRENSVPLFGEWKANSNRLYQSRKLPILFIGVDGTEDETEDVLEEARKLAIEYRDEFSFTHLDSNFNADVARRLGIKNMPEVLILSGQEVRKQIDYDNAEKSIREAIDEWVTK
eukprot:UN34676